MVICYSSRRKLLQVPAVLKLCLDKGFQLNIEECVCARMRMYTRAHVFHPPLALTSSLAAEVKEEIGAICFAKLMDGCCAKSGPPTEPASFQCCMEVVPWFVESHLGDLPASGLIGSPPSST